MNEKRERQFIYVRLDGIQKLSQSYVRIRDQSRVPTCVSHRSLSSPCRFHLSSHFSDFRSFYTHLTTPRSIPWTLFGTSAAVGRDPTAIPLFSRGFSRRASRRVAVVLPTGSRASCTWRGTCTRASAGRRDAAGKGASMALCSRWEFRSHASRCEFRFHVDISRCLPYVKLPRVHTCALARSHVQSRRAVRPDTELCWIACRDPPWLTWRDITASGSAPASEAIACADVLADCCSNLALCD